MNHGDASSSMVNGNSSKLTMMSYFARFNYTFADKYLIELTGRYDGSSRFTAKNRWGFFPSVSIGWRISEEHFFDPLKDAIDNLKIRASYGSLGNQDLKDYYPYASVLALDASYWFGDSKNYTTGIYSNALSNPEISWEKSQQFDFGLDITAFNTRLDVTFDYYIREISDMLQQFPVTYAVGLTSPWENAGNMRNNGWDLSVMWHDRIGKVKYNIRAMLSDVKNEVTDLYGNKYINDNNTTQEGFPISSWYGYVADGYFQSKEEINNYPVYGNNKDNVKPGYIKYKDISGPEGVPDGQITDADRTIIGDPQPRYSFSLNLGAEWNNFDFNVFLQGVGKRDIFFNGAGARPFWMGGTVYEHQLDSWSEENRNAEYPLLLIDGSGGGNMNNIPSSFWVKSGAYMRLKNVSVGYSLPKNILGKSGLSNVRFYLSGQNLLTIAKGYKGYDPEGDVSSYYPVTQVYTFGVDIKF
jgi:TonB-linked SusC/RagA family outer membrane protein